MCIHISRTSDCMASEVIIPVSFKPLLIHACEFLGFPAPIFSCSSDASNECSVVVVLDHAPTYKFCGGPGNSKDESCERACRKMLIHLMAIHGLCVHDVNFAKRENAKRCLTLFVLKQTYYTNMEQGAPPLPLSLGFPKEQVHSNARCVRLEFYSVLGCIIERFNIHVTPIEYLELGVSDHVAWLIVTCPIKLYDSEGVVSERSTSAYNTKQSVAEKTIQFLMPTYNFLVEDVSFHLLQLSRLSIKLEREAYCTIKDRIYGPVYSGQPQSFLDEELRSTPRGPGSSIPQGPPPTIPPKKRLRYSSTAGSSYVNTLDLFEYAKHPRKE